jgi:hypothetical protein
MAAFSVNVESQGWRRMMHDVLILIAFAVAGAIASVSGCAIGSTLALPRQ